MIEKLVKADKSELVYDAVLGWREEEIGLYNLRKRRVKLM